MGEQYWRGEDKKFCRYQKRKEEFRPPYKIEELCKAIRDDNYHIGEGITSDTIEGINKILEIPDLYDKLIQNKKGIEFSEILKDLVNTTTSFRKKEYKELTDDERLYIKELNRLILEETYPQKTPKFKEEEDEREPLKQVFANLETTFRNQKKISDANSAYYYKKHEELKDIRLEYKKQKESKGKMHEDGEGLKDLKDKDGIFLTRIGKEAEWLWWLPCGYGTRFIRICLVSGAIYLLFVICYFTGGRLTRTDSDEGHEFAIRPRLFDFSSKTMDDIDGDKGRQFVNALFFSLFILFKIGYRDIKISGKIFKILNAKYFIWTEWVIGYWMLASISITIYNTVPTINRLLSGVF